MIIADLSYVKTASDEVVGAGSKYYVGNNYSTITNNITSNSYATAGKGGVAINFAPVVVTNKVKQTAKPEIYYNKFSFNKSFNVFPY
jgi:hypothetical protein